MKNTTFMTLKLSIARLDFILKLLLANIYAAQDFVNFK